MYGLASVFSDGAALPPSTAHPYIYNVQYVLHQIGVVNLFRTFSTYNENESLKFEKKNISEKCEIINSASAQQM